MKLPVHSVHRYFQVCCSDHPCRAEGAVWVAYLESVLGTVAGAPDAHSLQHARVAQLLQDQLVIEAEFLLQRHEVLRGSVGRNVYCHVVRALSSPPLHPVPQLRS